MTLFACCTMPKKKLKLILCQVLKKDVFNRSEGILDHELVEESFPLSLLRAQLLQRNEKFANILNNSLKMFNQNLFIFTFFCISEITFRNFEDSFHKNLLLFYVAKISHSWKKKKNCLKISCRLSVKCL